jgi:parallel beta-helix repeat protein
VEVSAWQGEVMCASTTPTTTTPGSGAFGGTVWRFGHTFATGSNPNFDVQFVISQTSQDGKFIAFTTDWDGQLGSTTGIAPSVANGQLAVNPPAGVTYTCLGAPVWLSGATYTTGALVGPVGATNGTGAVFDVFQAITGGVSGSLIPGWGSTLPGQTLTDGTITWQDLGPGNCRSDVVVAALPLTVSGQINVFQGTDLAGLVNASPAGTTFLIHPGTYRLTQTVTPKNGDGFVGLTPCAPPTTPCGAILSGARVIGQLAVQDGATGYYKVTGQTHHGPEAVTADCITYTGSPSNLYYGCVYPEDLFFNGTPYLHVYAPSSTCPGGGNLPPTLTHGQWWFDYPCQTIWFYDNPAGQTVETSVVNGAFGGSANNVTIQYLTMEEFATMFPTGAVGTSQGVNALTQGTNWTVENSELWGNHSFGVRVNYQTQILNNYIHHNGHEGIGGGIGVAAQGTLTSSNTGNSLTWAGGPNTFNGPSPWAGGQIELGWDGIQGDLGTILTVNSCSSTTACTTLTAPGNNSSPIAFNFPIVATQMTNSGVLIQGNTISYNNYARFHPGFGAGGVKTGGTNGIILRGNTISNNLGPGIHFDDQSVGGLVDGNIITDNSDGGAVEQEISLGPLVVRNNIMQRNGQNLNVVGSYFQLWSQDSTAVEGYCNLIESGAFSNANVWSIGASNRGYAQFPPFQYLISSGNYYHHNAVIWDGGSSAYAGVFQNDSVNQSSLFGNPFGTDPANTPPDYNQYHMSNTAATQFVYDNNNSGSDAGKSFANFQAAGADVHGSSDANYNVGFPTVQITSPVDQASFSNSTVVSAAASDTSGISKVEFYLDWALQATVTSSPYTASVSSGVAGPHTVAAMAYSNAGVRNCYAVTLNER